MMRRHLGVLWCGVSCLAACTTSPDVSADKDGFNYNGQGAYPYSIDVTKGSDEYTAEFTKGVHLAFKLELEGPTDLFLRGGGSWSAAVGDFITGGLGEPLFVHQIALFQYDDQDEQWDLIVSSPRETAAFSTELAYRTSSGGRWYAVIPCDDGYGNGCAGFDYTIEVGADLYATSDLIPGSVEARVMVLHGTNPPDLRPAHDVRAALGIADGVTDSEGLLTLSEVPGGRYIPKFGPEGLGRRVADLGGLVRERDTDAGVKIIGGKVNRFTFVVEPSQIGLENE